MKRVVIVCTGNVARSPALAAVLRNRLPWIQIESAAVGRKAVAGLPVKRAMREILVRDGYAEAAEGRSRLLAELEWMPDLVICTAPVHMIRVKEILPEVEMMLCVPPIHDPAFGGKDAYEEAWQLIQARADDIVGSLSLLMPGERE